jgi:hypothetical protein
MDAKGIPPFARVELLGGVRRTICTKCYQKILDSRHERELAEAERGHRCDPRALAMAIRRATSQPEIP